MVIKDFECKNCGTFEALVAQDVQQLKCEYCSEIANRVFLTAPPLIGEIRTHFNPHFDLQVGKWFESAEHKKKFLKDTGRDQISGPLSPRKSNNTSIICSRNQALKGEGRHSTTRKVGGQYVDRVPRNTHRSP